jgi:hypothetical protein
MLIMKEKKCTKCDIIKSLSEFRKNGKYWQSKCKPCQYEYTQSHNKKNKEKYKKYQIKSNHRSYNRGQTFMNKHRALCGCQKCGDKRFWLIDYHHINPKEKDHPVTYYKTCTLEVLKNEIKKCIPLCRNCHTDFHYLEKQTRINIEEYVNLKKNER